MSIVAYLSAAEIAHVLRGKRCGSGFVAHCPAHEDRTPSLSLRDSRDGVVLVHCHTGCPQSAVIAALRERGLWPERERRWLTRAEWEEQRRRAQKTRERIQSSHYWALALEPLLETLLEHEPPVDELDWLLPEDVITERAAITRTLAELRAARRDPYILAAMYAEWERRDPRLTAGLVHAGERSERRWAVRIWRWIDEQR